MSLPARRTRLLPVTIAAMALLLGAKCLNIAAEFTRPAEAGPAPGPKPPEPAAAAPRQEPPAPRTSTTASVPEAAPASEAERALLADLRRRREALDQRARSLDQRAGEIAAAEEKLRARLDELTALQTKLEQLDRARTAEASANWAGLVRTYEAMKPRDAAAIFDQLDMAVLLPVLDRMNERRAAAVLAAMQPERARLVTQRLAELRVRQTTPPANPKS